MGAVRTTFAVALLVGLSLVLAPREGSAGGPSPGVSIVPKRIALVGSRAGAPDAFGLFTVVVNDRFGSPINGASVVIDLSGCSDLALCSNQLDAAATVNCAAKTTRKFTDVSGRVSIIVLGSSNGVRNATTLLNGAKIYANGALIGSPTAAAFDLDGANGVGINDLTVWLNDFGTDGNPAFGRSDFDGDGAVDINDLSVWLSEFGSSRSTSSCPTSCP